MKRREGGEEWGGRREFGTLWKVFSNKHGIDTTSTYHGVKDLQATGGHFVQGVRTAVQARQLRVRTDGRRQAAGEGSLHRAHRLRACGDKGGGRHVCQDGEGVGLAPSRLKKSLLTSGFNKDLPLLGRIHRKSSCLDHDDDCLGADDDLPRCRRGVEDEEVHVRT